MPTPAQCDECRALSEELRAAFIGNPPSPERSAELQAHSEAFLRMFEGSEAAADELFAKFPFRLNGPEVLAPFESWDPKVRQAIRKLSEHCLRTGHVFRMFWSQPE